MSLQVFPPSVERRSSVPISPLSDRLVLRPSQKAGGAALAVTAEAGIRYVCYRCVPETNTSDS